MSVLHAKNSDHEAFEAAMISEGYDKAMFIGFEAEDDYAYYDSVANFMYDAWFEGVCHGRKNP